MSYDLKPNNLDLDTFEFGAFSWPVLLEQCGSYFICIQGAKWFFVSGIDERMGDTYPKIVSNDGFPIADEEAKVMARIARNYVIIQRNLDWPKEEVSFSAPAYMQPWPQKIREDFVDKFEKFADWAERSGGFQVW